MSNKKGYLLLFYHLLMLSEILFYSFICSSNSLYFSLRVFLLPCQSPYSVIFYNIVWLNQALSLTTVHPLGIPWDPVVVHVAALFLTNVPVDATPYNQYPV